MSEQPDKTDGETDSTLRPTRRQTLGALAAAGVLGATAVGQEEGDLLNAGGGPMSDAQDEFRVQRYRGTFAERPDPGVARRVWEVDDPGHENHGAIYVDDGESWTLVDRKVGSLDADKLSTRNHLKSRHDNRHQLRGSSGPLAGDVAAMSDLSDWSGVDGTTISAETGDPYLGGQSMRAEQTDGSNRLRVQYQWDNPVDLSNRFPEAAFNVVDQPDDWTSSFINIVLSDDSGNSVQFLETFNPDDGGPDWRRLYPYPNTWSDALDMAQIETLEIRVKDEAEHTLLIDDIRFLPTQGRKGHVVIGFDDNRDDVYPALDIFDDHGVTGYHTINSGTVGDDGHLTADELQEFYEAGWDIWNHMEFHDGWDSDDMTVSEAREQVENGKKDLLDEGWRNGQEAFVYTYGEWGYPLVDIVDKFHDIAFTTTSESRSAKAGNFGDPFQIPRGRMTDLDDLIGSNDGDGTGVIDIAAEWGGSVHLYMHGFSVDSEPTEEELDRLLEYIAERDEIEVISPQEYLEGMTTNVDTSETMPDFDGGFVGMSSSQTLASGNLDKVEFDDVDEDPKNEFDTTSNEIVAHKDGVIVADVGVEWENDSEWSTGDELLIVWTVNGSYETQERARKITTSSQGVNPGTLVHNVSEGDTIHVEVRQDSGSDQTVSDNGLGTTLQWTVM